MRLHKLGSVKSLEQHLAQCKDCANENNAANKPWTHFLLQKQTRGFPFQRGLISITKKGDICPLHEASEPFCCLSLTRHRGWLFRSPRSIGERHLPSMWEMGMLASSASCRVPAACRVLASWTKSDALSVYEYGFATNVRRT